MDDGTSFLRFQFDDVFAAHDNYIVSQAINTVCDFSLLLTLVF